MTSIQAMPLAGRRIAVPESRQLDVFAALLERRGAEVLRCPLVGIHDTDEVEQVHCWLDSYIRDPFDDLILLTGEGLRRLLGFAERYECKQAFIDALAQSRTIVRGPKPAKALRDIGLTASLHAAAPTTAGVIETLSGLDLYDRRVGVQLYGDEKNPPLREFLDQAGVHEFFVSPYRYADDSEDQKVGELIQKMAASQLDAICFTSTPQIRRLYRYAKANDMQAELERGMQQTTIASVGPVVTDVLAERGVEVQVMPSSSFFLKPLVSELVAYWAE